MSALVCAALMWTPESYGPGARVRQQFPCVSGWFSCFWKFGLMVWHFGKFPSLPCGRNLNLRWQTQSAHENFQDGLVQSAGLSRPKRRYWFGVTNFCHSRKSVRWPPYPACWIRTRKGLCPQTHPDPFVKTSSSMWCVTAWHRGFP